MSSLCFFLIYFECLPTLTMHTHAHQHAPPHHSKQRRAEATKKKKIAFVSERSRNATHSNCKRIRTVLVEEISFFCFVLQFCVFSFLIFVVLEWQWCELYTTSTRDFEWLVFILFFFFCCVFALLYDVFLFETSTFLIWFDVLVCLYVTLFVLLLFFVVCGAVCSKNVSCRWPFYIVNESYCRNSFFFLKTYLMLCDANISWHSKNCIPIWN